MSVKLRTRNHPKPPRMFQWDAVDTCPDLGEGGKMSSKPPKWLFVIIGGRWHYPVVNDVARGLATLWTYFLHLSLSLLVQKLLFYFVCSMRSRVYVTVECPSVRLSVPSIDSSSGVQRVCCWAPCGLEIAIDSRRRRSVANAGSIVLTTEERSWPRSCHERVKICLRWAVCLEANVADDEAAWTKQSPPNVWMQCVRDLAPCVNIYGVNNLTQTRARTANLRIFKAVLSS